MAIFVQKKDYFEDMDRQNATVNVFDISMDPNNPINTAVLEKIAEEIDKCFYQVNSNEGRVMPDVLEDFKSLNSTICYIRDNVANITSLNVEGNHFDIRVSTEIVDRSQQMTSNIILNIDADSGTYRWLIREAPVEAEVVDDRPAPAVNKMVDYDIDL